METIERPQPTIREASNDDLLKIRKMHAQSWLKAYPNDDAGVTREWVEQVVSNWTTQEGIEKSKEHFKNVFGNPNHFYRIAEKKGEVVGLVHATLEDDRQHLGALYIDESEYGTGLAQQLMGLAMEWFDQAQPIDLEVVAYNGRAIRFYEKCGFAIVDGSEHLFKDKIPVVTMMRKGEGYEV